MACHFLLTALLSPAVNGARARSQSAGQEALLLSLSAWTPSHLSAYYDFVIVTIKPGSVAPSDGRELPLKLACKFAPNSTLLYIKAFTCWLGRSVN